MEKQKQTILIVDDQKSNRLLLKNCLKEYSILEASKAQEAFEKIENHKLDLIILDVILPEISGYTILEKIKQDREYRFIPVILLTSLEEEEDKIKSFDCGADAFVHKPFKVAEVKAQVRCLLRMKSYQDEREDVLNVLSSLVTALEQRDAYSKNHSLRVSQYAVKIAEKYHFNKDELETIRIAGMFHDIGKIGIRDDVLLKQGKLTDEEFEKIKGHPAAGELICQPLRTFEGILPYIRHHHERIDGNGYPDRLKGSEIPEIAKIIAVADTFDALTSNRAYRKAFPLEKVIAILNEGSGTQWEPKYIDTLLVLLEEDKETFLKHMEMEA